MRVIVSLTSYKERLKFVPRVVRSLLVQSLKPERIILNLHEDDIAYIGKELRRMIDDGALELLVTKDRIGPHTKYFHTMLAHRDVPVITVDDDHIYRHDMVRKLYDSYLQYPDCVSAMRVHRITLDQDGKALPYSEWEKECSSITGPSLYLMATGVGGVLYPPDILKLDEDDLNGIQQCLTADDIYLKYLESRLGINVVWVPGPKPYEGHKIWRAQHQRRALWRINRSQGMNDEYLKRLGII